MKKYIDDKGLEVIEYNFVDYLNGDIGCWIKANKKWIEKDISYAYLPMDELNKIKAQAEKYYWEKVNYLFKEFKDYFIVRWNRSGNPERLLMKEIANYEMLLFNEKLPLPSIVTNLTGPDLLGPSYMRLIIWQPYVPVGFFQRFVLGKDKIKTRYENVYTTMDISDIREKYNRIVEQGLKDYSRTNSPKCYIQSNDCQYIQVEAINLYYHWLNNFNNKKNVSDGQQTPTIQNLKQNNNIESDLSKPTLPQIALLCIYKKRPLNDNNASLIAKEYGQNSGEKLMRHYVEYETENDRTALGISKMGRSDRVKLKDIKQVIKILEFEKACSKQARKDLEKLEDNKNQYKKNRDYF
ncbi:hypothetical protein [Adhaeribacter radiodurans]|uniref:Uncharacterized protein n=1 Tax=Adhaeribacter radiodurans TaxID=2745197 RepID=A0A7L7LCM8_9BACT|nr:hypothetical protein [Adhaeribacter radiodurans]QMU30129.1 hypothetical protein HUW48_19785 [Adhaeribacter radiodurans]